MLKNRLRPGCFLICAAALAACSTAERLQVDHTAEKSAHAHLHPTAQNAGDYHVMSFMDRRAGIMGVQVLDRWEEPTYVRPARLRAVVELEGRSPESVWLVGKGWTAGTTGLEQYGTQEGATIYTIGSPWVRLPHDATLTVWVPLPDGHTHVLRFPCSAADAAATHSGLR